MQTLAERSYINATTETPYHFGAYKTENGYLFTLREDSWKEEETQRTECSTIDRLRQVWGSYQRSGSVKVTPPTAAEKLRRAHIDAMEARLDADTEWD